MTSTFASEFQPNFCHPLPDIDSASDSGSVPKPPSGFIGREKSHPEALTQAVLKEHETIKSGYVQKRYRTRKSWKTRWLVLRSHYLSVYKNEKEYELLYSIDLYKTSAISEVKKKKRPHVFGICTPDKLFYFMCLGSNEQAEWLRTLREARDSEPSVPFEKLAFASRSAQLENPQQLESDGFWDSHHMSSSASHSVHGLSDDQALAIPIADLVSDSSEYDHDLEFNSSGLKEIQIQSSHGISRLPQTPKTSPKLASDTTIPLTTPIPDLGSTVVIQGVLFKHCVGYKAWRSRWFVLRETQLCYYKNDKEYELHGMIPRTEIYDVVLATSSSKTKNYCFKIMTQGRTYKLAAPTSEERDAWILALKPTVNISTLSE